MHMSKEYICIVGMINECGYDGQQKYTTVQQEFSRSPIFTVFVDDHLTTKIKLRYKFDCMVHNGSECSRPQKENGKD